MKILFFAPHSAVWVHAFPEALIAEALQQDGHEVVYVGCGGTLKGFCVAMSSYRLTPSTPLDEREKICTRCRRSDRILRDELRLRGPHLIDLIGPAEHREVEAIVATLDREDIRTFERDDLSIGRFALYQFMLRRKRLDLDLNDQEWGEYLVEFRNALYAWLAGGKILDTERPDRVIVYNGLYSVNRVVSKLAERRGIPSYFMHAGGNLAHRLQTLLFGREDTFRFMPHVVSRWPRFKELPCSGESFARVTDHYVELLRGRSAFVYSKAKSSSRFDARAFFRVRPDQRLLVATMGSYDEEVAAEMVGARRHISTPLFPTQIDWVRAILRFIESRSDLFLVIRVHPREFPNRRDAAQSQHARLLGDALQHLPANAMVNWPSDGISIYDLAEDTDLFLNSWSSVGKEMSLLGLPVLIYSRDLAFYPPDLNYVGTTEPEYFRELDAALRDGWSADRIRKTYRWCVLEYERSLVDISDSFFVKENASLVSKVIDKLIDGGWPDRRRRTDCRARAKRLSCGSTVDRILRDRRDSVLDLDVDALDAPLAQETAALKREVRRLTAALYGSSENRRPNSLQHRLSSFANR